MIVFAFDSTTNLPKTGDAANLTAYVSKDYNTVTVLGDTSAAEMDATNAKGYYLFDLTQAETNADTLLFSAKSSTANVVVVGVPAVVFTVPAAFSQTNLAYLDASILSRMATYTQPTGFLAATFPTGTVANTTNVTAGTVTTVSGNVTGSVGSVTGAVGSVTGNVGGNVTGSVGSVASGGITNASLAADTGMKPLRTGTAQAGAAGSITLDAGAPATTNFFKNATVDIVSGTGAGQSRYASAYNSSTKVVTVLPNWTTNPDNTSVFAVRGGAVVDVEVWQNTTGVAAILTQLLTDYSNGSNSLPAAVVTVAANALTASALAADAVTEIVNGVWNEAQSGHTTAGTFGKFLDAQVSLAGGGSPSTIAAAVWDLATSGHTTSGTFGQAAVAAGGAGDPWITPLPGSYSAGQAGYILGNGVTLAAGAISNATLAADTGLKPLRTGTAQAGSTTTITLDAGASATAQTYRPSVVSIVSGTGAGQSRLVAFYVGATKIATVQPDWTTAPDNTSVFVVTAGGVADVQAIDGNYSVAPASLVTMATEYTGNGYLLSRVVSAANDSITAASFAADAGTEIAAAVWASATRTLTAFAFDVTLAASQPSYTPAVAGSAMTLTSGERNSVADALLNRNLEGGSSAGRLVKEALYPSRNKWSVSGTTLTVYATNDTTVAFTTTLATDPTAETVVSSDPA